MAKHFIPKKFYVARTGRSAESVVGFMQPMHKEGWAGRKETADKWASGRSQMDPLEWENKPTAGYVILNNTRRMMNKNVIWRVIHPLGFEFEITSDNFSDILFDITLDKGVITNEMVFVRETGYNCLLPADHPRVKETPTEDELFAPKASVSDVKVGDKVRLVGLTEEMIYLGSYHFVEHGMDNADEIKERRGWNSLVRYQYKDWKTSKKALFQVLETKGGGAEWRSSCNEFRLVGGPKFAEVIQSGVHTADECKAFIQDRLEKSGYCLQVDAGATGQGYSSKIRAMFDKPMTNAKVQYEVVKCELDRASIHGFHSRIVQDTNGDFFVVEAGTTSYYHNQVEIIIWKSNLVNISSVDNDYCFLPHAIKLPDGTWQGQKNARNNVHTVRMPAPTAGGYRSYDEERKMAQETLVEYLKDNNLTPVRFQVKQ